LGMELQMEIDQGKLIKLKVVKCIVALVIRDFSEVFGQFLNN